MPGLVDELQQLASEPNVSVADLLRKAKIVAVKLRQKDTAGWIDAELSGNFKEDVPEYRKVPVQLMGRNFYTGGLQPFAAPAWLSEIVNKPRPMPRPVRELEEIAASDDGEVFIGVPPGAAEQLVQMGAQTSEFYHMTTRNAIAAILDEIKTRVLDWALSLEQSGVRGKNMSFSPEEQKRAQQVTIHFNGTTNFAGVIGESTGIGASDIAQQQTISWDKARDIAAKIREGATRLQGDDAVLLRSAAESIDDSANAQNPNALWKALKWAKAALPKVGAFAAKVAVEHEIDSLLDLIPM